jgi:large subunit ribosomal protein L17
MRHRKKGKKLNRNTAQRKALFKNLIQALIIHEEIKITKAKAKAIKGLVGKLITKAKKGSLHARRQLLAFLQNKKVVGKLMDEIAPRFAKRKGGFTRLINLGNRRGDDAPMVKLEFVEKKKVGKEKTK